MFLCCGGYITIVQLSLYIAAGEGDFDLVKELIEKGADVFAGSNHDTVLH